MAFVDGQPFEAIYLGYNGRGQHVFYSVFGGVDHTNVKAWRAI